MNLIRGVFLQSSFYEKMPELVENPVQGPDQFRQIFYYFPGLKLSFRLTLRLKTRCSGVQSLLSGQK